MVKIATNIWLIWIVSFLNGFIFYQPIFALYLEQELHDFVCIAIIMAIGSVTVILFEVPSGIFSDLFGNKRAMIFTYIFRTISLIFLWIGKNMVFLISYVVIDALAESLTSGTVESILFNSSKSPLNNSQETDRLPFKKALSINMNLWPAAASFSVLIGGYLSVIDLRLPIELTLIPSILCLILSLFLTTSPEHIKRDKNFFHHMKQSVNSVFKNSTLILLTMSGFLVYAFAEVAFQFKSIYLEQIDLPLKYFGYMSMFSFLFSFIGSFFSEKATKILNEKFILIGCQILIGIFFVSASFIVNPFLNGFILSIESFFWGMRWPVQSDWINSLIQSDERATINSLVNFFNHLSFALFTPLAGYLIQLYPMIWIYRGVGLMQIITVIFLLWMKKRSN